MSALLVRTTHIFRLTGFPSFPQTVHILLLFVLLKDKSEVMVHSSKPMKEKGFYGDDKLLQMQLSIADLGVSLPGDGYALTQLAKE